MSLIKGSEIFPSGRTGMPLTESCGSFQTVTWIESSAPIT
jgi:hypothetical protein